MTERLYYHDARLLAFDARVIEQHGDAQHLILDRSAFYPTSGGQPHDTGTLGGVRVVDVTDDGDSVIHVTDAPVPLGPVAGHIDEARRIDHMQQHTAQHLLSAIAADRFGWETVSVHFGAEHSTIEFATDDADPERLATLEREANDAVAGALPVTADFEDAADATKTGLRKATDRTGRIRVITIAGIDRSACGGTHVGSTSEIGAILLLDVERVRRHARVGFVAGRRTLDHARHASLHLAQLAKELGSSIAEATELLTARLAELRMLREREVAMERELGASRIAALHAAAAVDANGLRTIAIARTSEPLSMIRAMAQAVAPLERTQFVATADTPPTIIFATTADSGIDAGAALKAALVRAGGRGGGSARIAQGTAPSIGFLEAVARSLLGGSTQ
ncbi:MAG TPA: alanyl-tRNA editing protein [Gemmatimonadales bacterium]